MLACAEACDIARVPIAVEVGIHPFPHRGLGAVGQIFGGDLALPLGGIQPRQILAPVAHEWQGIEFLVQIFHAEDPLKRDLAVTGRLRQQQLLLGFSQFRELTLHACGPFGEDFEAIGLGAHLPEGIAILAPHAGAVPDGDGSTVGVSAGGEQEPVVWDAADVTAMEVAVAFALKLFHEDLIQGVRASLDRTDKGIFQRARK